MLFEVFLRNSIEGEAGYGALKKWCGHAPGAAGTAPTAEIIAINANQALVHIGLPFVEL